jgi:hypothetical protein
MELVFDYTALDAYLNRDPDSLVIEQLLLAENMSYTYDMILSDLHQARSQAVGSTQARQEIEDLRSTLVVWNYPAFDTEASRIQNLYLVPYSAGVCIAIARQLSCPVVTASHLIFDSIMDDGVCGVLFTR